MMRNGVLVLLVLVLFAGYGCAAGGSKEVGGNTEGGKGTVQDQRGFEMQRGPAEIAYQSGIQYRDAGNLDDAISQFKTATSLRPTYLEAWTELGSGYTKIKDYQSGIAAYERALELSPDNLGLMQAVAYNYLALEKLDKAEEYYLRVVGKDTLNYDANRNLGFIYQKQNEGLQAIKYYRLALEAQPKDAVIMGTIASLYEKMGDKARNVEYLKMAIEAAPDNYNFKRLLAFAYMNSKDFASAVPIFQELIQKYPDQALYHLNYGLTLSQIPERRVEAAAELETALKLKGEDALVCAHLTKIYYDLGQYQKAIDTAKRGLNAGGGGQEPMLYYFWGTSLSKLGLYDEAIAQFEKVVATKDLVYTESAKKEIARQVALKKRAAAAKGE